MVGGMTQTTFVIVAAVAMILMNGLADALTTHKVGDATGWGVPPSATFYQTWAAKQNFLAGDILDFEFSTGLHTVAVTTSKAAYDKCDASHKNAVIDSVGPFKKTLTPAGTYYFFCTVATHCLNGQKFTATVSAKSPAGVTPVSPPPPPHSPSPPTTAPPKPLTPPPPPKPTTTPPPPKPTTTPPPPKPTTTPPPPKPTTTPPPPKPTTTPPPPKPTTPPTPTTPTTPPTPPTPTTPPPPPTKSAATLTSFTFSAASFMLALILAFLY